MHLSLASSTTTKTRACDSKSRRRAGGGGQACTRMSPQPIAAAASSGDASAPPPATRTGSSARLNGGASASTSGRTAANNGNQLGGRDAMRPLFNSVMSKSNSTVAAASSPTPSATAAAAAAADTASSALGLVDESGALSLANVRASLIRQEDTIVFSLIERAQFARNGNVYERGLLPGLPPLPRAAADRVGGGSASGPPPPSAAAAAARSGGDDLIAPSLLEHMLVETEAVHGRVRRYTSPDEHAFFPALLPPEPLLPPLAFASSPLAPCADGINLNGRVLEAYLSRALPLLTRAGDDGNYGSAALGDVAALQALSKRVHYGKFVAEAKWRASPTEYRALAAAGDREGIMALLTDARVEDAVVARVRAKAAAFGREVRDGAAAAAASLAAAGRSDEESGDTPLKVDPDAVAAFYRDVVLPLTKDVQVLYLLERPKCD